MDRFSEDRTIVLDVECGRCAAVNRVTLSAKPKPQRCRACGGRLEQGAWGTLKVAKARGDATLSKRRQIS